MIWATASILGSGSTPLVQRLMSESSTPRYSARSLLTAFFLPPQRSINALRFSWKNIACTLSYGAHSIRVWNGEIGGLPGTLPNDRDDANFQNKMIIHHAG